MRQQYLHDPASDGDRARVAERIDALELARLTGGDPSGALSAVIDDMRCELQAMQPRLVTFDTRAHA